MNILKNEAQMMSLDFKTDIGFWGATFFQMLLLVERFLWTSETYAWYRKGSPNLMDYVTKKNRRHITKI